MESDLVNNFQIQSLGFSSYDRYMNTDLCMPAELMNLIFKMDIYLT